MALNKHCYYKPLIPKLNITNCLYVLFCNNNNNRYTVLPQDLKLAVRLNHKQESTAKQGKYFRSVHKINLASYPCSMSFTHLSGT